jgi:hypothetical protein
LGIFVVAIFLIAGPAHAQNYNLPWCAILDNDGNLNCAYYNQQQCQETLSGVGGECVRNPSPPTPALTPSAPYPNAGQGSPLESDPGPPPGLDGSAQQQVLAVPNNLFTAAGFIVKYATTPEKRAILRSLPPDKLVKRTKDGKLYYVYADAARCNCAYVGTPQAYAAYQNGGNDPNFGSGDQQSNAMQTIDSDVGAPYIPANIAPSMDSILDPQF